jgi:flagellar biosynthesis anti-sigma factor FlgM
VNISNDVSQAQIASSTVATPSPSAPSSTPSSAPLSTTAGVGAAARSSGVSPGSSTTAPASQESDQATISSASGVLSTALTGSDVRTAKVASLQASINAGTYNVPASSVADKILSSILGS